MTKLTISFLLLFTNLSVLHAEEAEKISCKKQILNFYKSMGRKVDPESFSSAVFEDFKLTVAEFNTLNEEKQTEIYKKIMPIKMKVDQVLAYITYLKDEVVKGLTALEVLVFYGRMSFQEAQIEAERAQNFYIFLRYTENGLQACEE